MGDQQQHSLSDNEEKNFEDERNIRPVKGQNTYLDFDVNEMLIVLCFGTSFERALNVEIIIVVVIVIVITFVIV